MKSLLPVIILLVSVALTGQSPHFYDRFGYSTNVENNVTVLELLNDNYGPQDTNPPSGSVQTPVLFPYVKAQLPVYGMESEIQVSGNGAPRAKSTHINSLSTLYGGSFLFDITSSLVCHDPITSPGDPIYVSRSEYHVWVDPIVTYNALLSFSLELGTPRLAPNGGDRISYGHARAELHLPYQVPNILYSNKVGTNKERRLTFEERVLLVENVRFEFTVVLFYELQIDLVRTLNNTPLTSISESASTEVVVVPDYTLVFPTLNAGEPIDYITNRTFPGCADIWWLRMSPDGLGGGLGESNLRLLGDVPDSIKPNSVPFFVFSTTATPTPGVRCDVLVWQDAFAALHTPFLLTFLPSIRYLTIPHGATGVYCQYIAIVVPTGEVLASKTIHW